ncbi:MAG: hypothetical protein LBC10_00710 [Deltaproteobacteria bacterium]|jgi:hypothetical protein|nr:hypothetical protein [Deltaproteobacteria bacterium]
MQPYFQGQVDVFCAIYAVLNGLLITHRLRAESARSILHESILDMSRDREMFRQQLDQHVEYHDLVDRILNREVLRRDLLVRDPFGLQPIVPQEHVWNTLERWLGQPRRAAILRFVRSLALPGEPNIRHWTTAESVQGEIIALADCSLEKSAIREIKKSQMITEPEGLRPGQVYVDPSSIRLMGAG